MFTTMGQYRRPARVRVRDRGGITIPADIRRDMELTKGDTLSLMQLGEALIMTRTKLRVPEIAVSIERMMQEDGVTLEDLLQDLDNQRAIYVREQYGIEA